MKTVKAEVLEESELVKKYNDYRQRIEKLEESRNYVEAAELCEEAAELMYCNHRYEFAGKFYSEAGSFFGIEERFRRAGEMYLYAGDSYHNLNHATKKREQYFKAAEHFELCDEHNNAVRSYRFAAAACIEEKNFTQAGNFYFKAADLLLSIKPTKHAAIIDDLRQSMLAFARDGRKDDAKKSYELWKAQIDRKEYDGKEDFYFDKLIRTFLENGLNNLASQVYIYKMDRRQQSLNGAKLRRFAYCIWRLTSNYGQSWSKWFLWGVFVVALFTIIYLPSQYGCLKFSMGDMAVTSQGWDGDALLSCLMLSITNFTTFALSKSTPLNWPAFIVVLFEMSLGFVWFGLLGSIIYTKVIRY